MVGHLGTPELAGLFTVNPPGSWMATGGTMSVSGGTATSGTACPGTRDGYACRLDSFTLGFDVTASEPVPHPNNAATGSRTASLGPTTLNGYTITLDYDDLPNGRRAAYDQILRQAR